MARILALLTALGTRHAGRVTAAVLVVLVALAWPLAGLRVENRVEGWVAPEALAQFHRFEETFGAESLHLFAFRARDLFTDTAAAPDEATRLDRYLDWVAELSRRPGVVAVIDPVGLFLRHGGVGTWADLDWNDPQALARSRAEFVAGRSPALSMLLAPDLSTLGLLLVLDKRGQDPAALLADLRGEFDALDLPAHEGGILWFSAMLSEELTLDLARVTVFLFLLSGLMLLYFFRSPALVAAIFLGIGVALALSLAASRLLGTQFNLLTLILFPLVFSVGLNSPIHLFSRRPGGIWSLDQALERVLVPITLAAATSAAGSMAFLLAPQPVLAQMGLLLPLSVFFSFAASLVVVPAAYHLLSRGLPPPPLHVPRLTYIHPGSPAARRRVSALLLALSVAATAALARVEINPDALFFFAPDSRVTTSFRAIEENLTGLLVVEAVARSDAPLADPAPRAALTRFVAQSRLLPGFTALISPWELPPEDPLLPHYLTRDGREARITFRFRNLSGPPYEEVAARLHALWDKEGLNRAGISLALTGELPMILEGQRALLSAQAGGFLGVFVLVALLLFLARRQVSILLLASAANLLPLLLMVGAMVLLRIPVNSVNLFVAAVMLGVVVDDTMHLLHAYQSEEGIDAALAETGVGLWLTAVVLLLAFSSLLAARITPIHQFGLLSLIALFLAHLCEVFLLPAMANWLKRASRLSFK